MTQPSVYGGALPVYAAEAEPCRDEERAETAPKPMEGYASAQCLRWRAAGDHVHHRSFETHDYRNHNLEVCGAISSKEIRRKKGVKNGVLKRLT